MSGWIDMMDQYMDDRYKDEWIDMMDEYIDTWMDE